MVSFLNVGYHLVALGTYLATQKISYLKKFEGSLRLVRWCANDIRRSDLLFWCIRTHIRSWLTRVYLTENWMQRCLPERLNWWPFLASQILVVICFVISRPGPDFTVRLIHRHASEFLTRFRRWDAHRASGAFKSALNVVITGPWVLFWLKPNPRRNAECSTGGTFFLHETWLCIFIRVANNFTCWADLPTKTLVFWECPLRFAWWGIGRRLANKTMFGF